jgi:ADP-ribose pyrophosphatase
LARGLTLGEPQRDQDENLQIFDMSVQQCMDAVQQGLITDGKTIIALMWLEKYLNGSWQPMELPS